MAHRLYREHVGQPGQSKQVLEKLKAHWEKDSGKKQVVVMDVGIATEENLEMLKDASFDYICVPKANSRITASPDPSRNNRG